MIIETTSNHLPDIAGALLHSIPAIDVGTSESLSASAVTIFNDTEEGPVVFVAVPNKTPEHPTWPNTRTRIWVDDEPHDGLYQRIVAISDRLIEIHEGGYQGYATYEEPDGSFSISRHEGNGKTNPMFKPMTYVQTVEAGPRLQPIQIVGFCYSMAMKSYFYITELKEHNNGVTINFMKPGSGLDLKLYNKRTRQLIKEGYQTDEETGLWAREGHTPRLPAALLTDDVIKFEDSKNSVRVRVEGNTIKKTINFLPPQTFLIPPEHIPDTHKTALLLANLSQSRPFPNQRIHDRIIADYIGKLFEHAEAA